MPKQDRKQNIQIEREIERRVRNAMRNAPMIFAITVGGEVLKWSITVFGAVLIVALGAWAWVKSAPDLAGRNTNVDVGVGIVVKVFASRWVYLLATFIASSGWYVTHRTLKKRLSQIAADKKELEVLFDQQRSSSDRAK